MFFGEFALVFEFADGGMVGGEFFEFAVGEEVEAGIAYVADVDAVVLGDGECEDTGHAVEFGVGLSQREDFVIGGADGLADLLVEVRLGGL